MLVYLPACESDPAGHRSKTSRSDVNIIGAVGMVCTVGTSVYEHWDQLEAYFTGTEVQPDPTLRDVLPGQLREVDLFKVD